MKGLMWELIRDIRWILGWWKGLERILGDGCLGEQEIVLIDSIDAVYQYHDAVIVPAAFAPLLARHSLFAVRRLVSPTNGLPRGCAISGVKERNQRDVGHSSRWHGPCNAYSGELTRRPDHELNEEPFTDIKHHVLTGHRGRNRHRAATGDAGTGNMKSCRPCS